MKWGCLGFAGLHSFLINTLFNGSAKDKRRDEGGRDGNSCMVTLPKTKIAPENGWLQDYFSFRKAYFQGYVSFRQGTTKMTEE